MGVTVKHVLVTGARGFVGRHLVPALLKSGYTVHVLSRRTDATWGSKVKVHTGDLEHGLTASLVAKMDAIIHLACKVAINESIAAPASHLEYNLAMNLAVLDAAREAGNAPLIIFASSDRQYGQTKRRIVRETEAPFPIEPYTASKIMGETALQLYNFLYYIPYIALRFDSIYGPGQPQSMFISDVILKMKTATSIETGPLSVQKNFLFVEDGVEAILAALRAPHKARNRAYNIGGSPATLSEILKLIKTDIEKRRSVRITTKEAAARRLRKAEVNGFTLSTEAARRLLKWRARTSLTQGLSKTITSFLS